MPERRPLSVWYASSSDPGQDPSKQVNEDSYLVLPLQDGLLATVCDGMGGHMNGRQASQLAIETIRDYLQAPSRGTTPHRNLLKQAIANASAAVHHLGGDGVASERPGATCVAAWFHSDCLELAHVGDSRCYRVRAGRIEAMTCDHSVIEAWVQAGQISREMAQLHPDAHRITRALGIHPHVEVELRPTDSLQIGDRFLLCSDGLTDLVADPELATMMVGTEPLEEVAQKLVRLANARGGHDNITVVLLCITESVPASPSSQQPPPFHILLPVPGASTERFEHRAASLDRTLPLGTVDRTLAMPIQLDIADKGLPGHGTPPGCAKTQALNPALVPSVERSPAPGPGPTVRGTRGRYAVFWVLGLALLGLGLAAISGLTRC